MGKFWEPYVKSYEVTCMIICCSAILHVRIPECGNQQSCWLYNPQIECSDTVSSWVAAAPELRLHAHANNLSEFWMHGLTIILATEAFAFTLPRFYQRSLAAPICMSVSGMTYAA